MYPWDVLEIEETDDKKVIKKAYAKLIRQYRPDEYPDEFQEINLAYKFASQSIQHQANIKSEQVTDEINSNNTKEPLDLIAVSDQNEMANTLELNDQRLINERNFNEVTDNQIESMFNQVHELAFSTFRRRFDLKNWLFLEIYHEIHDISLRDQVAKEMFRRVAEYNLFHKKQNKTNRIPVNVVIQMNALYQWEDNWQEYNHVFPQSYIQQVFADVEKKDLSLSLKYKPKISTRLYALCVDFLIYFMSLGVIIHYIRFIDFEEIKGSWYFWVGFAMMRLATEMSLPARNSLGAMFLRYQFLDQCLNKPERKTVLMRFIWFEVMLIPLYVIFIALFEEVVEGDVLMGVLALYACLILIFAYLLKGSLPHDYFSKTQAAKA